jgi:hypothetical protein
MRAGIAMDAFPFMRPAGNVAAVFPAIGVNDHAIPWLNEDKELTLFWIVDFGFFTFDFYLCFLHLLRFEPPHQSFL